MSYYARFLSLLWELLGEDDFRRLAHWAVERYIREKKREEMPTR